MFSCSHLLSIWRAEHCVEESSGKKSLWLRNRGQWACSRSLSANGSPMLDSGTSHSTRNCRLGWNSDLTSTEKPGRDRNENSASGSRVWHRDDNPFLSTARWVREMNQRSSTRKPGREVQNELTETTLTQHNLEISNTRCIEIVFANVRQKLVRPEDAQIVLDQKVNVLMSWLFMSTTMKAAIHLGENDTDNLVTYINAIFEALKTLFDITQKLILNQKHEVKHVSTTEWQLPPWMRNTLRHDKVIQLSKAKVNVYSDAVLCLGRDPQASRCHGKVERTTHIFPGFRLVHGIIWIRRRTVWVRVDFFPGHTTVEILREIQTRMTVRKTRPG